MTGSTGELKKQIAEKNLMLKKLDNERNSDEEKVRKVKVELDNLLYLYFKSLKCS